MTIKKNLTQYTLKPKRTFQRRRRQQTPYKFFRRWFINMSFMSFFFFYSSFLFLSLFSLLFLLFGFINLFHKERSCINSQCHSSSFFSFPFFVFLFLVSFHKCLFVSPFLFSLSFLSFLSSLFFKKKKTKTKMKTSLFLFTENHFRSPPKRSSVLGPIFSLQKQKELSTKRKKDPQ